MLGIVLDGPQQTHMWVFWKNYCEWKEVSRPEKELKKIFIGLGSVIFPKKDSITSECRLVVTATFMAYSVYIQAAEKIRASIFLFQLYNNWNITVGLIIYSHYRIEIKKF